MWIMVPRLISHKYSQAVWRFDSIEVGEKNYYYSYVSQQPGFESFFFLSFVLLGMLDLVLFFASRSHTQFLQLCQF